MHVAIAGGHGKIALLLARVLADRDDRGLCLIRNPDHADDVREAGGEPVLCDLEHTTAAVVADAIAGISDSGLAPASSGPPWCSATQ